MQRFIRSPNPLKKGASEFKVPLFKGDLGGSGILYTISKHLYVHGSQVWRTKGAKDYLPRNIVWVGSLLILWLTVFGSPAFAANLTSGTEIFQTHCAGCHLNGGNIVRRNKTLKLKALERNGVNTLEAIATLVAQGKNNMPAYSDRLTPDQIQIVSKFVLDQAKQEWR